jgi:hypothetical protein
MTKKIISVGFEIPGNVAEYVSLRSNRSLLDADIVVFKPSMAGVYYTSRYLQGKPRLSEHDSFQVIKDAAHWRSEIQNAFNSGKTILIYLPELVEYFVENGEKGISGTGKGKTNVTYVSVFSNYSFLPLKFEKVVSSSGKSIKFARDTKFLTLYWKEYVTVSNYEVILEGGFDSDKVILVTKTGDKAVGLHLSNGKGNMVLLPALNYSDAGFVSIEEDDEGDEYDVWTPKAIKFGKTLISHIVEIDKTLQADRNSTPAPQWANNDEYRLSNESTLEKEMQTINTKIEKLEQNRMVTAKKLEEEGKLRYLLYETGHILEHALLEALRLMGFTAEPYKDRESEFDAVFVSPEGRFLGEAEGKDNSAINIDKLSQLERNLQEDFQREDVKAYANGVLFGNAYRLQVPSERPEFFTEKCCTGADRARISLVRTTDLFEIARYLKESKDTGFAQKCREAILQHKGKIVAFPKLPIEAVVSQDEITE